MAAKFQHIVDKVLSLSPEERQKQQIKMLDEAEQQHCQFTKNFPKGLCYLCKHELTYFDKQKPCLHWLLRRNQKIKKTQLVRLLKSVDIAQLITYLRWVASQEQELKNINDLREEFGDKVFYQTTIKFEDLTWSISVSNSDLDGHGARKTNFPHYHFEFRIHDNRFASSRFVDFGDFHIPLSEYDIFMLEMMRGDYPDLVHYNAFGESYSDMTRMFSSEELVESMTYTEDESQATFHNQIILKARPGEKISGVVLAELLRERKKTGKTIAQLSKKLSNVDVSVVVTPTDDTVNLRHNTPPRGKK